MAEPLKAMLRTLLDIAGVQPDTARRMVDGDLKEVPCYWLGERTPRHAMQRLGTEWRDMLAPDLWIRIAESRVGGLLAQGRHVVVDDIRFPAECAMIRRLGGPVVRPSRPGFEPTGAASHASEMPLPPECIDEELWNELGAGALRIMAAELAASGVAEIEFHGCGWRPVQGRFEETWWDCPECGADNRMFGSVRRGSTVECRSCRTEWMVEDQTDFGNPKSPYRCLLKRRPG